MDIETSDKINELLVEFREHRDAIQTMVSDLEVIKDRIDSLFPDTLDKRYVKFFEEKVKATTELFKALLDMRKEIGKSLKDEIDIRRRMDKDVGTESEILEDLFDVRKLAKKVEKFQKSSEDVKEKVSAVN